MGRFVLWSLAGITLLLVILALGVTVFVHRFDIDDYRADVARALSDRTLFDIRIEEPLWLSFDRSETRGSLVPVLDARSISVRSGGEGWTEPVAHVEHLSIRFDAWASLLERRLMMHVLDVRGVGLHLRRDAEGRGNWALAPGAVAPSIEPKSAGSGVVGITPELMATFENVELSYRSEISSASVDMSLSKLEVSTNVSGPRTKLRGEGILSELPLALSATLDSRFESKAPFWSTPGDFDLDMSISWGDAVIGIDGTVLDPRRAPNAKLAFVAKLPDLESVQRLLNVDTGADFTGLRPLSVEGRIVGGGRRVRLEELEATLESDSGDRLGVLGSLGDVISRTGLDLTLELTTDDLNALAKRADVSLPALRRLSGQARLIGEWARPYLREMKGEVDHESGARVAFGGLVEFGQDDQLAELTLRVDVDTMEAGRKTVDDLLLWRGNDELLDEEQQAWVEARPEVGVFGPLVFEGRLHASRTQGRLEDVVLSAGRTGADWVGARGRVETLWPEPSGIDLEVSVASEDLEAALSKLAVETPPRLRRLRANASLHGSPESIGLRNLQVVARRGNEVNVGISGDVPRVRELLGTELAVAVSAIDAAAIGGLFGLVLPNTAPVELNAKMQGDRDRLANRDIMLRIGKSQLRGEGELIWRGLERPRLTASLHADLLRLVDLGVHPDRLGGDTGGPSMADRLSEVWDEPIPFEMIESLDAQVEVTIDALSGREDLNAADVSYQLSMHDGILEGAGLSMSLGGTGTVGRIRIAPFVNSTTSPPIVKLDVLGRQLDLERAVAQVTRGKTITGSGELVVGLRSQGRTAGDIVAGLRGDVFFFFDKGRVSTKYSYALQIDYGNRFDPDASTPAFESVGCLIADTSVLDGVVSFETLFFDSEDKQILGSGSIDLNDATLLVVLTPALKRTIPGSVTAAVQVSGRLSDPSVVLEPFATASSTTQGLIERALLPVRRYIPLLADAYDGAGQATVGFARIFGINVPKTIWRPGVDLTCKRMLDNERIHRATAHGSREAADR